MAVNSYGYPNLIAPGSIFARFAGQASGHIYSALGHSDLRVTAATSGTRRVNIAAGWVMGKGVMVNNTTAATLDLPAPSGASQWFLIGVKRWVTNPAYDPEATPGSQESSPYISQLVYVAGNASKAVPTVTQNPGTDDTQWLALVRLATGQTLVQEVVDLRLIAGEGCSFYIAHFEEALGQLDTIAGAQVYRTDIKDFVRRVANAAGALSWKRQTDADEILTTTGSTTLDVGDGWGRRDPTAMERDGRWRIFRLRMRRAGDSITADSAGAIADSPMVQLHPEDRPAPGTPIRAYVLTSNRGTFQAGAHVSSEGWISLDALIPGAIIATPSGSVDNANIELYGIWKQGV